MNGYLLDTNTISELTRAKPATLVVEWFDSVDESKLYLSVLTLGEIRKGVAALARSKRRSALEAWLETELLSRFSGRIVPVDAGIANRWGFVAAEARRNGKGLPVVDGLMAATALHYNFTVVSRNARDFAAAQVPVLNPWEV